MADNLKLTFPMATAATQIAWGLYASPGGFERSGQGLSYAVDNLQWVTNYLGLCANNGSYVVAQVRSCPAWHKYSFVVGRRPS